MQGDVRPRRAETAASISGFSLYDGVYMVDHNRTVVYLSGIAANLTAASASRPRCARPAAGVAREDRRRPGGTGHEARGCHSIRTETEDGRSGAHCHPAAHAGSGLAQLLAGPAVDALCQRRWRTRIDSVLVLLHNATEAVQKNAKLNVKSAIIQEVHHRVKNNLQNIAAILRIQAARRATKHASI